MKVIEKNENKIGKKDYQMENREWTDRYKELIEIRIIDSVRNLYQIKEKDKLKGIRFTLIDTNKDIEDEVKWR